MDFVYKPRQLENQSSLREELEKVYTSPQPPPTYHPANLAHYQQMLEEQKAMGVPSEGISRSSSVSRNMTHRHMPLKTQVSTKGNSPYQYSYLQERTPQQHRNEEEQAFISQIPKTFQEMGVPRKSSGGTGRNHSYLAYQKSQLGSQAATEPSFYQGSETHDEIQRRINKQYLKLLEKNEDLDTKIKSKIKGIEKEKNVQIQDLTRKLYQEQQEKNELKILLTESKNEAERIRVEAFQKVDSYFNDMKMLKDEKERIQQHFQELKLSYDKVQSKLQVYKEEINEVRREKDSLSSQLKNQNSDQGEFGLLMQEMQSNVDILNQELEGQKKLIKKKDEKIQKSKKQKIQLKEKLKKQCKKMDKDLEENRDLKNQLASLTEKQKNLLESLNFINCQEMSQPRTVFKLMSKPLQEIKNEQFQASNTRGNSEVLNKQSIKAIEDLKSEISNIKQEKEYNNVQQSMKRSMSKYLPTNSSYIDDDDETDSSLSSESEVVESNQERGRHIRMGSQGKYPPTQNSILSEQAILRTLQNQNTLQQYNNQKMQKRSIPRNDQRTYNPHNRHYSEVVKLY